MNRWAKLSAPRLSVGPLFNDADLAEWLPFLRQELDKVIAEVPPERILSDTPDELLESVLSQLRIQPLELNLSGTETDVRDCQIDVSQDPRYRVLPGQRRAVQGSEFILSVPFRGDRRLFFLKPNQFYDPRPLGLVAEERVDVLHRQTEADAEQFESSMQQLEKVLCDFVAWSNQQVRQFNADLETQARERLERRRDKVSQDRNLISKLKYPLRSRQSAPTLFNVPAIREKLTPGADTPRNRRGGNTEPNAALDDAQCEEILNVLAGMARVIELNPSAFARMKEEDLRWLFLIPLNLKYEGRTSGEAFNYRGKTDILIRDGDRNIFIAECKIWKGAKSLTAAIEQVLQYVTWRDTKTAILLFSRNASFSSVLGNIPLVVRDHSSFRREIGAVGESGFRFVIGRTGDQLRDVELTILAFDVSTGVQPD